MLPHELKASQFAGYPPQARQLAAGRVSLLQQLPIGFLPLLLREIIVYDWKFPPERNELDHQLAYLESRSPEQRRQLLAGFEKLQV